MKCNHRIIYYGMLQYGMLWYGYKGLVYSILQVKMVRKSIDEKMGILCKLCAQHGKILWMGRAVGHLTVAFKTLQRELW